MKTKGEVIAAAYGEHWDAVKEFVDKNGWIDWGFEGYNSAGCSKCSLHRIQSLCGGVENSEYKHIRNSDKGRAERYFRPISLRGIEANNGWTKIESESDLPTKEGKYFVYSEVNYGKGFRIDIFTGRLSNTFENGNFVFSHYQEISMPDKPHF